MEPEKYSGSDFVYCPNGSQNLATFTKENFQKVEVFKSILNAKAGNDELVAITSDHKYAFTIFSDSEKSNMLLWWDFRAKKFIKEIGQISQNYGNYWLIGPLINKKNNFLKQRSGLINFGSFDISKQGEKWRAWKEFEVKEEHLAEDVLIFGEFLWGDQRWGNHKSGIRVRLNRTSDPSLEPEDEKSAHNFCWTQNKSGQNKDDKMGNRTPRQSESIFYKEPGTSTQGSEERFSFKFSDLKAKVGDRLAVYYWVGASGGHAVWAEDFTMFTIPEMTNLEQENDSFSQGHVLRYSDTPNVKFSTKPVVENWKQADDENTWLGDRYYDKDNNDDF